MSPLEKVTQIVCLITTEKLNVDHDGNTTQHETANGVYFRLDRNAGAWQLHIEEGKQVNNNNAPKGYTEINTQMTDSTIEFSKLDGAFNPDPLLKFIGIEDIRDGLVQNKWNHSMKKTHVSIKTEKNSDRLIIRKAHIF